MGVHFVEGATLVSSHVGLGEPTVTPDDNHVSRDPLALDATQRRTVGAGFDFRRRRCRRFPDATGHRASGQSWRSSDRVAMATWSARSPATASAVKMRLVWAKITLLGC